MTGCRPLKVVLYIDITVNDTHCHEQISKSINVANLAKLTKMK